MNDLGDFFNLIGEEKKEKEKKTKEIIGEVSLGDLFATLSEEKKKIKEEENKKSQEKEEILKKAKVFEKFLFTDVLEELEKAEVEEGRPDLGPDETNYEEKIEEELEEIEEKDPTIEKTLENLDKVIPEEIKEARKDVSESELSKLRSEIQYIKQLVHEQGGGGEVNLKYLDDIVGIATNASAYDGKFLKYDNSIKKFVFDDVTGSGGGSGNYAKVAGIATFAQVAGIATYADTAGIATNSNKLDNQNPSYYLDYNNFSNTPTIPTNNNQLSNGAGYITTSFTSYNQLSDTPTNLSQFTNNVGFVTFTNNNQLTNGAGYITTSFTNTNQLTNGAGFITASDNITGTSGGLSGTPNIVVGIATGEFKGNVTGDVTGDVSGNITGTACTFVDGVFTGNVTIGGTLTYDDVKNVDSVGLITARSGIDIGGPVILHMNTATSTHTSTSQAAVDTFSATEYRSANYQIQITRGTEYHVTSLNIVHDGTDVFISEFGTIATGNTLATFTSDINSGNVRILATPASSASTTFKVVRNLIRA
tara:strand:- start:337 stop:1938 length:1602 start_codon:yes stop_codon:yes gene_type:complete